MMIETVSKDVFELTGESKDRIASLVYVAPVFSAAKIETGEHFLLSAVSAGTWATILNNGRSGKARARIRTGVAGTMSVNLLYKKSKLLFKKSSGWKTRFSLFNRDGDELLTIIPAVNWEKLSHDYILQLNEEFENECDPFLILQAVHCANCSLSMMTGGPLPALVSI